MPDTQVPAPVVVPARTPDDRYRSLDLLRGIACISVLVFHASGKSPDAGSVIQELIGRLWIGVPVFYVISGYSITASIERMGIRGTSWRAYFGRRLKRILPPYWVALAILAAVATLLALSGKMDVLSHQYDGFEPILPPWALSPWQWLGSITLTEGWRDQIFTVDRHRWYLGVAWTLGYEEQFYIVAGLLLLLARTRWFEAAAAVTVGVAVLTLTLPHNDVAGFWFNGRWIVFAFGIGVYYHAQRASGLGKLVMPAAIVMTFGWWLWQPEGLGEQSLVSEIGVGALTAAALIPLYPYDARINQLTIMRPVAWCGLRCYSLYLLHWPIAKAMFWVGWVVLGLRNPHLMIVTMVPVTFGVSLAAAAVFFRYVELPCMSARGKMAEAERQHAGETRHPVGAPAPMLAPANALLVKTALTRKA